MADVYIPAALRRLTSGERVITVAGETVGDLIDAIDRLHPGIKARLVNDGEAAPRPRLVHRRRYAGARTPEHTRPCRQRGLLHPGYFGRDLAGTTADAQIRPPFRGQGLLGISARSVPRKLDVAAAHRDVVRQRTHGSLPIEVTRARTRIEFLVRNHRQQLQSQPL